MYLLIPSNMPTGVPSIDRHLDFGLHGCPHVRYGADINPAHARHCPLRMDPSDLGVPENVGAGLSERLAGES